MAFRMRRPVRNASCSAHGQLFSTRAAPAAYQQSQSMQNCIASAALHLDRSCRKQMQLLSRLTSTTCTQLSRSSTLQPTRHFCRRVLFRVCMASSGTSRSRPLHLHLPSVSSSGDSKLSSTAGSDLFCNIKFVINRTLGESASGRIVMQVDKARSPSSRTLLRPALPNNYSMLRSELQQQPVTIYTATPRTACSVHVSTCPSGASNVQCLPFCITEWKA